MAPSAVDPLRRRLCALTGAAACLPVTPCAAAAPLDREALAELEDTIEAAIGAGRLPGAVLWVERDGQTFQRAFGRRALEPRPEAMTVETVFDVASLTKPVITGTLAMQLFERGDAGPEESVVRRLPEFSGGDSVTWRHLLTHSSALPAGIPLEPAWQGLEAALALACRQQPTHALGTFFRYSDVNYILLGVLIERVAGMPLAELAQQRLLRPLGMVDSGYLPLVGIAGMAGSRIAPTQFEAGHLLRGEVHDPTARRMGGVAGHAGLFSTVADLARFVRMLLGGGALDGARVLAGDSVRAMTASQSPPEVTARRGFGWDIDSPYSRPRGTRYPPGSFGHTGFTGCAMWIDPGSRSFYVLLSNRVHPRGNDSIVPLYGQVGTLAAKAAGL